MSLYAILDSDSDNEAVVKITAPKKEKDVKKDATAPTKATTKSTDKASTDQKSGADKKDAAKKDNQKKLKDNVAGDKKPDRPKKDDSAAAATDPADTSKDDPRGGHRPGKGDRRHGGRGGRGGRGPRDGHEGEGGGKHDRDPNDHEKGLPRVPRKREYDRRSSTGRTGEQRKDSRGPHSFGSVRQEAADAEKDPASAEPEVEPLETVEEGASSETEAAAVVEEPPVPEGPKVFTYDEYLRKRTEELANVIHKDLLIEKKQERVVDKIEGLKTKEEEETVFMSANKAKNAPKKSTTTKSNNKSTVVDVAFKVAPAEEYNADSGDRRRGPRGSPRDGRGSGGRREGSGHVSKSSGPSASIDVFDASSFPSL